jgi:hypothetical protein
VEGGEEANADPWEGIAVKKLHRTLVKEKREFVEAWPVATFANRMHDCYLMLYLHGALTDSMAVKVKKRIKEIVEKRKTK